MQARVWALLLAAFPMGLAGCSDDGASGSVEGGIRKIDIHIGWNEDGRSQYMTPSEVRVKQGDKVQFRVINDDDPNRDYNDPSTSFKDNFHDVALDYPGACDRNPIEHEAPAGQPPAVTECNGNDYFVAHAKGTFEIECEVRTNPSHRDLGMRADFIVE